LLERERWSFRELVLLNGGEEHVFGTFLALLELVKSRQIVVSQEETGGPISLSLRADRDESALAGLFRDEEAPAPKSETAPETTPEPLAGDGEGSMV
jgi:chromatin segregation and condensation protein Rec8/ScpA/Scc1 (kleisin family)